MGMKLKMMKPKAGGGFAEKFRLSQPKHMLRVYPFTHDNEMHLAALNFVHFGAQGEAPRQCLGTGCPICLEAQKTGNKRLRKVTRYPMLVVDMAEDEKKMVLFDAPASVYKQIYSILEEGSAEDYLGDDGMDFIIKTNAGSQPSDRYNVTIRVKGSEELELGEATIDVIEEVEHERESDLGVVAEEEDDDEPEAEEEENEDEVPEGKVECVACEGTGKNSRGKKCAPCKGTGYTDEPEEEEEEEEPEPPKRAKKGKAPAKKAPAKEDLWADEDEDEGADDDNIQDVKDGDEEEGYEENDEEEDGDDISAKDKVVFKSGSKKIKGVFTGKFRKGKMVIEANGQLWTIESDKVTKA